MPMLSSVDSMPVDMPHHQLLVHQTKIGKNGHSISDNSFINSAAAKISILWVNGYGVTLRRH